MGWSKKALMIQWLLSTDLKDGHLLGGIILSQYNINKSLKRHFEELWHTLQKKLGLKRKNYE